MRWVADVEPVAEAMGTVHRVAIVAEGGAFFLLRLDSAGRSFADTWHPTREAAIRAAEGVYGCRPGDWRTATGADDYSSRSK